jgi:alkanesulfonate monooxygenase SsuD/methylene tetrahydromethanopterin reductase-like flavin-dependent oxidoreductase (luciferase family)
VQFAYVSQVWSQPDGISVSDRYKQLWDELVLADQLGYDYAVTTEHHFNPESGWMSDPTMFCTSVGVRTKNIRLAPMGYQPPLWNPVRLVETLAMLDNVVDGRLDIGLASGVSPLPFIPFRADYDNRRELTVETAEILLAAFGSDGTFSFEGKYHSYTDLTPAVMPVQKPSPPIWVPSRDREMLRYCAQQGFNTGYLWLVPRDLARERYSEYIELWNEQDHGRKPKIAYDGMAYVADTEEEAIERMSRHLATAFKVGAGAPGEDHTGPETVRMSERYRSRGETQAAELVLHARDARWLLDHNLLWCGTPETVAQQIAFAASESPFNVVNLELRFGQMDFAEAAANTQAFAEGVMPKLRDLEVF